MVWSIIFMACLVLRQSLTLALAGLVLGVYLFRLVLLGNSTLASQMRGFQVYAAMHTGHQKLASHTSSSSLTLPFFFFLSILLRGEKKEEEKKRKGHDCS